MSATNGPAQPSFVLLLVGKRRLALRSDAVVELAPPVRLHKFPHTSPLVSGVIVRRGWLIPVFDAASVLVGHPTSTQRFYLVARRRVGTAEDFGAVPVNGECELASGQMLAPPPESPPYIAGALLLNGESVDVLDFNAFASVCSSATSKANAAEMPQ